MKYDYNLVCCNCGKDFSKTLSDKPRSDENHYCSQECVAIHKNKVGTGIKYICKYCNSEFDQKHKRNYFCSDKCRAKYGSEHSPKKEVICSNCGKTIERIRHLKNREFFCSRECESEFRVNQAKDIRVCPTCKIPFECRRSDELIFCSTKCQGEWQSQYRIGKNSSTYKHEITDDMRVKKCEYCGKDMFGTPKSFEINRFCSRSCAIAKNNKSLTKPHRETLEILDKNMVGYDIEFQVGRYCADVILNNSNLLIEVNGTYWHSDIRFHPTLTNVDRISGINKDKKKKKKLTDEGYLILYLWEYDITNKKNLCEKLILEFIENNGILDNYHSMNYKVEENILVRSQELLIPHFEK